MCAYFGNFSTCRTGKLLASTSVGCDFYVFPKNPDFRCLKTPLAKCVAKHKCCRIDVSMLGGLFCLLQQPACFGPVRHPMRMPSSLLPATKVQIMVAQGRRSAREETADSVSTRGLFRLEAMPADLLVIPLMAVLVA